jgi:glutamate--cysteine ligase
LSEAKAKVDGVSVEMREQHGVLRDREAVRGYVERVCFKTGPPGLVGAELEWIVVDRDRPTEPVPLPTLHRILDSAAPPPHGSRITFEPGGQVELSSPPLPGTTACWRALDADARHVQGLLDSAGLAVLPTALDPYRPPQRQLRHPRYDAMARYFDRAGFAHGPTMMNSTAAVQVNLDVGHDLHDAARRWRLLHAVGPTLVAAFANSPVHAGVDTGWKSGRQRVWQELDPGRTTAPAGDDPVTAFTAYALDAHLMLRRDGDDWAVEPGRPFGTWLDDHAGADPADLDLHLSTLFPPVRPRGWFEVRYVDAQPARWWPVPVAVLAALVDDARAGATATDSCAGLDDWTAAARHGLAAPGLRDAAGALFGAALAAMSRTGEDPALIALVRGFDERYVRHGRSPADDPIEEDS